MNESARCLKDFQIYDASINFDPENVSIVKTLDKNKLAHLTIEIFFENFLLFLDFKIF